jgi:serine/threonine protein kinase
MEADLPKALQLLLGTVVAGRYVVDAFLGMGGMAIVFSGRHATLDRKVAIKFLRPEYTLNPEIAARFDREARAASSLEHPNCIQVFDCGSTKAGLKFMVMPLLEGAELARVLVELASTDPPTPIPPSQAVGMGMQLLGGLEHAHSRGLVHRDLKPDNIFVTRDHEEREVLKIVDFGIAKVINTALADGLTTKVGAIVGTPAYISPEQALGREVDARADLYATGVLLYQLLAGAPPFMAADARGLLYQHATQPPPPLLGTIPPKLRDVVFKLLAKKPDDRYPSATEAARALEAAAQDLRRDPTPWVSLLDLEEALGTPVRSGGTELAPGRSERSGREVMDDALKRLLSQETNHAHDQLNSGIFSSPDDGWDAED